MRKTSNEGLELIKSSEGLRLRAYKCAAGVDTIGYGHTRGVSPNDVITEEQASAFLVEDVEGSERAVSRLVKVDLAQCQFDALVDFVFNLGEPSFRSSTLLRKINAGCSDDEICAEFRKWDKVGESKFVDGHWRKVYRSVEGLTRRREREVKMWLKHLV